MNYYIFSIKWSQTDHEKIIVEAGSKAAAITLANRSYRDAAYVDYEGQAKLLKSPY